MTSRHSFTALLATAAMLLAVGANAASSKRIVHSIDASGFEHVDLDISVAEMDIEIYDGDSIEIDVQLRAERRWWLFGRRSVDGMELDIDESGDSIDIRFTEDNVEQDWLLRIPTHLAISMDLGVGEIDIDGMANDLHLDLGVGAVEIIVADMDFESIRLSTGVGDSSLRGFGRGTDNERNVVGADSSYYGDGEFAIEVEVGVGDTRVVRR